MAKCKYCNDTGLIETSTLSEEDEKFYDKLDIVGKMYSPCYKCNAKNKNKKSTIVNLLINLFKRKR